MPRRRFEDLPQEEQRRLIAETRTGKQWTDEYARQYTRRRYGMFDDAGRYIGDPGDEMDNPMAAEFTPGSLKPGEFGKDADAVYYYQWVPLNQLPDNVRKIVTAKPEYSGLSWEEKDQTRFRPNPLSETTAFVEKHADGYAFLRYDQVPDEVFMRRFIESLGKKYPVLASETLGDDAYDETYENPRDYIQEPWGSEGPNDLTQQQGIMADLGPEFLNLLRRSTRF